MTLVTCEGCARHIRADEEVCPFCRGDKPAVGPRGLVVAAIVGASLALTGCPKREPAALYGGPPDPEPTATATPQPEEGGGDNNGGNAAPEGGGEGGNSATTPTPEQPPVKALYGAPAAPGPEAPRR